MSSIQYSKKKLLILILLFFITLILLGIGLYFVKKVASKREDRISQLYFENVSKKKEVGRLVSIDEVRSNVYYKVDYPVVGDEAIDQTIAEEVNKMITENEKKYLCNCTDLTHYYFMDYETYIGVGHLLSLVLHENFESKDLQLVEQKTYSYLFDLDTGKMLSREEIFKENSLEVLQSYVKEKELKDDFAFYMQNDQLVLIDYGVSIPILEIKDILLIDTSRKKDYSNQNEEPIYTLVNQEYQVIGDVVSYKQASSTSTIVGTIKKGTTVKVYSTSNKGWSILFYNNQIVYVESKALKEIEKNTETTGGETSDKKVVYAITDVNIRKEANAKAEVVGELKSGDSITKTGEVGSWTQVEYNGQTAYIATSCLSQVKIKKREVKLNVPPQGNLDATKPMVALTFDDGPNPVSTPMILDVLEKYNVHATFFDLGNLMKRYPAVVQREAQLGEVGTHTYSHKNLNSLSVDAINEELRLSREAFQSVLGYEPILLRPPYGNANATVRALVDMPIIHWDVDSLDWKYRNKDLTLNEIDKYGNLDGKIILMHSIYTSTAEAVEILVPDLLDRGYQVVSVSELATYKGYTLETGTVYHHFK